MQNPAPENAELEEGLLQCRETASQVARVSRTLKPVFGLRTICVYGGGDGAAQLQALEEAPHIVVATPGRLLELLKSSSLPAGMCSACVPLCLEAIFVAVSTNLARVWGLSQLTSFCRAHQDP